MQNPVGYLVKRPGGLEGVRGMFYDYVVAENGVFVEAEGELLAARVPVATGKIRGLAPCETKVVLRYGLIPKYLFDLALDAMLADTSKELYVAVTWSNGYHLYIPEQKDMTGSISYLLGDQVILDLHSHGKMTAWFSGVDNKDEQGLRLYGVVGKLPDAPELQLRIGVYGYHAMVPWREVFEGSLEGVRDAWEIPSEPLEDEINHEIGDSDILGYHPSAVERFFSMFRWDL